MTSKWAFSDRLAICHMSGCITYEEFLEMKETFFERCAPDMIVDFSEADLSCLSNDEIRSILSKVVDSKPDCVKKRIEQNGFSIWIGGNDLGYGLGRMIEIYAEIMDYHCPVYAVKTAEDAIKILSRTIERRMLRILGIDEREGENGNHCK